MMIKKIAVVVIKLAVICAIGYWLKGIYMDKIYNAPVAVADRLENASQQIYEQKLIEARALSGTDKIIVMIDVSAGGEDNGLQRGDICEKDINLGVALEAKKLIDKQGNAVTFLTRDQEASLSDRQRIELYDIVKPQYYIRLEVTESDDVGAFGTEVLYSDSFYSYKLTNSRYAKELESQICEAARNNAIGIRNISDESNIWLEKKNIPAAIVVLGYISNEKEREALSSPLYQQKLAKGIAEAVGKCINNEAEEETVNNTTEEVEE